MTHIFIVWANGLAWKEQILNDIEGQFLVHCNLSVKWDEDKFADNLRVFYSRSWQHFSPSKIVEALQYKKEYCGTGAFSVIVFDDPNPTIGLRETTEGPREVNTNVFDLKQKYRQMTGGGHLVHGSNDESETNRDLTLLFGRNVHDFLKDVPQTSEYHGNCVGVGGYRDVKELFYVLNNTINYCVLRNFECLPDDYTVEGHGDIDLLVDNKQQMACMTLARQVYAETYRVYHTIQIAGEEVPFDFRHIGDNYYDIKWQRHILANRVLAKDLFYIPNNEDLFYSLLYHAYIQKLEVKDDYVPKLRDYAETIGLSYSSGVEHSVRQLDAFMASNGYEYICPEDVTVVYNLDHLGFSEYAFRYGRCVKRTEEDGGNGYIYSSRVFENGDSYVKIGTDWLVENEALHLKSLQDSSRFPRLLACEPLGNGMSKLEMSKVSGEDFAAFFGNMNNQHGSNVRRFLRQMADVLTCFCKHDIVHRDLSPSNIIVSKSADGLEVGIVDLGWAVNTNEEQVKTPANLGGRYASTNAEIKNTDCFALGVLLMEYWPDLLSVCYVASLLFKASKGNTEKFLRKISRVARLPLSPYDEFRLLLRRHQRLLAIRDKMR